MTPEFASVLNDETQNSAPVTNDLGDAESTTTDASMDIAAEATDTETVELVSDEGKAPVSPVDKAGHAFEPDLKQEITVETVPEQAKDTARHDASPMSALVQGLSFAGLGKGQVSKPPALAPGSEMRDAASNRLGDMPGNGHANIKTMPATPERLAQERLMLPTIGAASNQTPLPRVDSAAQQTEMLPQPAHGIGERGTPKTLTSVGASKTPHAANLLESTELRTGAALHSAKSETSYTPGISHTQPSPTPTLSRIHETARGGVTAQPALVTIGTATDASKVSEPPFVASDIVWDTRPGGLANTPTNLAQPQRTELPPHVAQAMAEALKRAPDKAIEIALSPAELGRVRMTMSPQDTGMSVWITAERGETLELMRRHIDDLDQALADLGFEDVSFTFEQNDQPGDEAFDHESMFPGSENTSAETDNLSTNTIAAVPLAHHAAPTGIDMRL